MPRKKADAPQNASNGTSAFTGKCPPQRPTAVVTNVGDYENLGNRRVTRSMSREIQRQRSASREPGGSQKRTAAAAISSEEEDSDESDTSDSRPAPPPPAQKRKPGRQPRTTRSPSVEHHASEKHRAAVKKTCPAPSSGQSATKRPATQAGPNPSRASSRDTGASMGGEKRGRRGRTPADQVAGAPSDGLSSPRAEQRRWAGLDDDKMVAIELPNYEEFWEKCREYAEEDAKLTADIAIMKAQVDRISKRVAAKKRRDAEAAAAAAGNGPQ